MEPDNWGWFYLECVSFTCFSLYLQIIDIKIDSISSGKMVANKTWQ